jgi:hypothetical protein
LMDLADFIGRPYTNSLQRILRKEKLPRCSQIQGRGFLAYGFDHTSTISDSDLEAETLNHIRASIASSVYEQFIEAVRTYEEFVSDL